MFAWMIRDNWTSMLYKAVLIARVRTAFELRDAQLS
jgi:hypothetical protein